MKNLFKILTAFTFLITFNSCADYVDGLDKSPNSPTDVPLSLLVPSAGLSTVSTYTGQLARMASIFTQQSKGRQFQYELLEKYDFNENDVDNDWNQIYNRGLINSQLIIDKAGTSNPHSRGIGRVLKALNLGIATDYWGDIPNKEALKGLIGESAFNPAFDSQESVIQDIQSLLDGAIADFGLAAGPEDGAAIESDLINKSVTEWITAAYILKARYANRLSKKDPIASADLALANVNAALTAGGKGTYAKFGSNANEFNQWYAFNQERALYMTMGTKLMGLLNSSGDPRTSFYAEKSNGQYSDSSIIGSLYGSANSPLPLVTLVEAKFIQAEALLRKGNRVQAIDAYNEAVSMSVLKVTGAEIADPFKTAVLLDKTTGDLTLEQLMTQKYIAMFTQPEVWADYRRTTYPTLSPNAGAVVNGIPQRLPTAQSERLYNTKAVVVSDLLAKVWWAL